MPRFLLLFRGGIVVRAAVTDAERAAQVARWDAWSTALGAHRVPGGFPLANECVTIAGADRAVTRGDRGEITGTYLLEAPSLEAAAELARGCPILDVDGSVEVRPVLLRPG